jgi:hypothetical protein
MAHEVTPGGRNDVAAAGGGVTSDEAGPSDAVPNEVAAGGAGASDATDSAPAPTGAVRRDVSRSDGSESEARSSGLGDRSGADTGDEPAAGEGVASEAERREAASTGAASTGAASTGAASTGAASTGAASTGAAAKRAASEAEPSTAATSHPVESGATNASATNASATNRPANPPSTSDGLDVTKVAGPLDATKVDAMRPIVPRQPAASGATAPARAVVTVPQAVPQEKNDRRRRLLVIAAVVVLVALVLLLIPLLRDDHPKGHPGAAPTATKARTSAAPQQPSAPRTILTSAPAPTGVPGQAGGQLPPGWHTYKDRTGFSVAVPGDWTVSRKGSIVYFDEPNGSRLLGIDQSDSPKSDPVADWRGQEAYRTSRGDWAGYRLIKIVKVNYFKTAADWEFTYAADGGRMHVLNRGFVTGTRQAHAIYWSTPESQWNANAETFRVIAESFKPNPQ